MAYLRNKLTEWIPAALAAIVFVVVLTPDDQALPVQTWTYEGVCRELVAGSTEGRQALVGSLWHAPLPTLIGLPAAALLPRGAAAPHVARTTILFALAFLFYVLLRFCRRRFRPLPAWGCWFAFLLLLSHGPALMVQPQTAVAVAIGTATLLKLADWCGSRQLADLVKFSFALAGLVLCGAPLGGWTLLLALLPVVIAGLDPELRPRFQGILILGLLPALYALGIWLLMSRLILSDTLYAWRFLVHDLVTWQGWPEPILPSGQIATLACCALIGAGAAIGRDTRTALLGLAGVALLVWTLLLQGFGLHWAADAANTLLALTTLLAIFSALGKLARLPASPLPRLAIAAICIFYLACAIPPPPPASAQATQSRQAQREILEAVEGYVTDRTPYGRIFICSYRGLGLLEGEQRERFVACLDLHIDALRERYRRQNLFLLIPIPEAEAALECTVWRHRNIYAHGVARALFAGDWGDWRLYEIVTAPTADQLDEWRR